MTKKDLVQPWIDSMKPKPQSGALPTVTACPYCGVSLSQTGHQEHRQVCGPRAADFAHDAGGRYNPDGTFPQT